MHILNARYDNDERRLLEPLILQLIGTQTCVMNERVQALTMLDETIRVIAPMGLVAVKWPDLAAQLQTIAPIVDTASARAAQKITSAVKAKTRIYYSTAAGAYAATSAYFVARTADYAADLVADGVNDDDHNCSAAASAAMICYASADAAGPTTAARSPILLATITALERVIAAGKS
jgi:hypothetical protein